MANRIGRGDDFTAPLNPEAKPTTVAEGSAPPAIDDFETIKRTLIGPDGEVRKTRPAALNVCDVCGTVHYPDKPPICICINCKKAGQIVWCGWCMVCAWTHFAQRFGEVAADNAFPNYGNWRRNEVERLKDQTMPWDQK